MPTMVLTGSIAAVHPATTGPTSPTHPPRSRRPPEPHAADVDVLVVGAGITGIYQLYRAREAGFSALLVEAGERRRRHLVLEPLPRRPLRLGELHLRLPLLPGAVRRVGVAGALRRAARDRALPQPRGRPLRPAPPHPLRRPGHRRPSTTRAPAPGAVATDDGDRRPGPLPGRRHRRPLGALSAPTSPAATTFGGEAYHTGLWPAEPVDFAGKRVAVVGTGVERRAGRPGHRRARSPRSPCTSARPTGARRSTTRRSPPRSRPGCGPTSSSSARSSTPRSHGFHHPAHDRTTFDDPTEERQAFYEKMWSSPGFTKLTSNYLDLLLEPRGQRRVVRVHRRQDPRPRRTTRTPPSSSSPRTTASARSGRRS